MSKIERNLFLLCFASLKGERKKISKTYVTQVKTLHCAAKVFT